jgi:hypothetical protein
MNQYSLVKNTWILARCLKATLWEDSPHVAKQLEKIGKEQCCGSGSAGSSSARYGSGSGSFYNQAKIVRKPLISTVLCFLYDFFSFEK